MLIILKPRYYIIKQYGCIVMKFCVYVVVSAFHQWRIISSKTLNIARQMYVTVYVSSEMLYLRRMDWNVRTDKAFVLQHTKDRNTHHAISLAAPWRIVVSSNNPYAAVEHWYIFYCLVGFLHYYVTKNIYSITLVYYLVPIFDYERVAFLNAHTAQPLNQVLVAEMEVACKKHSAHNPILLVFL